MDEEKLTLERERELDELMQKTITNPPKKVSKAVVHKSIKKKIPKKVLKKVKRKKSRKHRTRNILAKTSNPLRDISYNPDVHSEKDIAMDFAVKVHKKFDTLIKASVLFGSQTTAMDSATEGSDIDVILIVDDAAVNWDMELVAWYREELGRLIAAQKYSKELHINTVRLVTWWHDLLHGDPVVINILRYGEALIDSAGFFNPLKALLLQGKIKSTPEAVYSALQRVPGHISRSRYAEMSAIEGVYWAMVDSSQAALMTAGKMPPSPEHLPKMLKETFVDAGMLKIEYVKSMSELYTLHKSITHGLISNIKGQVVDEWQDRAERFLSEMTRIIDVLLEGQNEK